METLWSWLDSHKEALENSLVSRLLNGKDASTSSMSLLESDIVKPEPAPRPAQNVKCETRNAVGLTTSMESCP